jgi:hypothetical protein
MVLPVPSIAAARPAVSQKTCIAHRLVTDICDTSLPLNASRTAGLRKRLLIVEDYQQPRELMQDVLGEMCDHVIGVATVMKLLNEGGSYLSVAS